MARRKPKKARKAAPKPRTRSAPDWAPRFLARLAGCGNILASCQEAAVGRATVYDRRDADKAFAKAMREALEEATDLLEAEARRRAVEGWEEPVFGSGGVGVGTVEVGAVRRFDSRLLLALLQAHRPEKFRVNHKHEHSGALQHKHAVDLSQLSDKELETLERLAERAAGPAGDPG